jgi:serine/threonine protein kinase
VDLQGKTIGQYQLVELIHQGQNTVYRGFQPSMNRQVAVKVLNPSLASDPGFVQGFNQDMQRIAGLTHPNLLPIYDYGQQDGQLYIVSRYVETGTLKDRLPPAFSLQQAQAMIKPIAQALAYLHNQGVAHGNLKPSNILIDPQGQPLLTDLGYSQGIDTEGRESVYLSPEQAQGISADQRTDVYALGVLLYQMLIGEPPAPGVVPSPRSKRPDLPPEVEAVILKAMAQYPDQRYQTPAQFSAALASALAPKAAPVAQPAYQPAPPPQQQAPESKGGTPSWLVFLLGGLAILCLLAELLGVGIFAGGGLDQGAPEPAPAEPAPAPEQPAQPSQPDASLVQGLFDMVESIFDSLASIFQSIFGGGSAPEPPGGQPPEQPADAQPPPEEPAPEPPPEQPADAEEQP